MRHQIKNILQNPLLLMLQVGGTYTSPVILSPQVAIGALGKIQVNHIFEVPTYVIQVYQSFLGISNKKNISDPAQVWSRRRRHQSAHFDSELVCRPSRHRWRHHGALLQQPQEIPRGSIHTLTRSINCFNHPHLSHYFTAIRAIMLLKIKRLKSHMLFFSMRT